MKSLRVLACCGAVLAGFGLAASAQTVTPVPGDPLTGSGSVTRTLLTYTNLMSSTQLTSMVNDNAFAVPTGAAPPIDNFQGTLTLAAGSTSNAKYTQVYLYSADTSYYSNYHKYLPAFSFQFVQNGSYFIPVTPGFNITGDTSWNISLGTGRAWTEASDQGYTRVAFPFSLVEYDENCMHHGEMTFLFSNTKSPSISNVEYQIDMDSCAYWTFDMTGTIGATYTPSTISNATTLENAEAAEITNRIPVKPISSLATDYPSSGFTPSNITGEYTYAGDIETYGVYFNGINYVGGCNTRATGGTAVTPGSSVYAFCSELRLPSYSVAKTAFVNMALTKLGQDYGSSIYSSLVNSYIPSTYVSQGGTWTSVTLDETSDMATGNYNSTGYETDENSSTMTSDILDAVPYTTKIGNSFKYLAGSHTTPGTTWVYHTSDAFILTSSMQYLLRGKTSNSNDLSTYMNTNVYIPLNLSAAAMNVLRTDNVATSGSTTTAGYPIGSYGMFLNQDDMVKIANFMNAGTGQISGTQTIDATRLQDTLFRSSQSGLVVPDSGFYTSNNQYYTSAPVANTNHYNNDIWEKTFTPTEFTNSVYMSYPTLPCSFNVTYMSGYGGNTIELYPNGAVFYIFSDGAEFYEDIPTLEVNKLAPMCPGTPAVVNASELSFSTTSITPVTQSFTITNPNSYTISLSVPAVSGSNASLFAVSSYCSQLAAGASCPMTITYTPTGSGNSSATLTVPTSDSYVIGTTVTNNSSSTITLLGYEGPTRTSPTITWSTPAAITYGTALSSTQLNASSGGVAGTFTYSPASGTVLAPGVQTLSAQFTPTNLATYSVVTQTVSLQVNGIPTSISWTPSTLALFAGSAIGSSVLNATSATAGTISYTATAAGGSATAITSASKLAAGTYTLTATLVPNNVNYATSTATQTLVVTTQNIWIINNEGSVSALNASGTAITTSAISGGGLGVAIDSSGDVWSINSSGGSVAVLSNTGSTVSSGYSGGGISGASALAIDGAGQVWIANGNGSLSVLSNSGAAVSPATGYTDSSLSGANGVAIDISGNVWISNGTSSTVEEVIGGAVPVAPLATAVQNSTLGVQP